MFKTLEGETHPKTVRAVLHEEMRCGKPQRWREEDGREVTHWGLTNQGSPLE